MAKDKFKIKLACPKCGAVGIAEAVEEDGWAYMRGNHDTEIKHLPDGFRIVDQQSRMASVNIYCSACDVSAVR